MSDFYQDTSRVSVLYSLLQDELSRDIFWARVKLDLCPSVETLLRLIRLSGLMLEEDYAVQLKCCDAISDLLNQGKRLFLYGAGIRGKFIAKCLLNDGVDITGFCDRQYDKFTDGLLDKPVLSPQYLLENKEDHYIVITSCAFREEIVQFLKKNKFPLDHILPYFSDYFTANNCSAGNQYFEFPALFPKGTAFVDGGCFDGQDSIYFAKWCEGEYSKIFAFEPDTVNFDRCKKNLSTLANTEVIHAGLGGRSTEAAFLSYGQVHSRFVDSKKEWSAVEEALLGSSAETVRLIALDELSAGEQIGFIKMDIEGTEWQALHGAEKTIIRDKPLLAICVYHVPGDTLAIMDYLSQLVPEYRFWLRHYGTSASETVLYASVD